MNGLVSITNTRPASCLPARGFTLFELIIVLGLAGILTAFAIPSFKTSFADQRVKAFAQDLHSSLARARSEAMFLGGACSVVVHPVNAADWAEGWFIVADTVPAAATSTCTGAISDPTPNTLFTGDPADPKAHILASFVDSETVDQINVTTAPGASIVYNRNGRIVSPAGTIDFTICDDGNLATRRDIQLSVSGLPEIRVNGSC